MSSPTLRDSTLDDLSSNPTKEKFLFCFIPSTLDIDSFCGCAIRSGIKISSAILAFISISNFYTVIKEDTLIEELTSIILSILYLTAAYFLFTSSVNLEWSYAKIGYYITVSIFIIDTIDFIIVGFLILFGYYYPFDNEFYSMMVLFFLIFGFLAIIVELYIIWLSFCFTVHLKLKRMSVVCGDNLSDIVGH